MKVIEISEDNLVKVEVINDFKLHELSKFFFPDCDINIPLLNETDKHDILHFK